MSGLRIARDRARGRLQLIHIQRAATKLKAIVVVDNTACGTAVGGVRMAPDVSAEECFRLAHAMTYKNAAAGLPHGGGKSVTFGDPRTLAERKEQIIRAFADAIRGLRSAAFRSIRSAQPALGLPPAWTLHAASSNLN
jgi:glutamate dehydrogenase (NAD(P)+)